MKSDKKLSNYPSACFLQNLTSEKELIEKMEKEVERVRAELTDGGHRPSDISMDTGALTIELAKKDRELAAKVIQRTSFIYYFYYLFIYLFYFTF